MGEASSVCLVDALHICRLDGDDGDDDGDDDEDGDNDGDDDVDDDT